MLAPLVLIVDDDEKAGRLEGMLLRSAGFASVLLLTAESAVTAMRYGLKASVLAIDLMLPDMQPEELIVRLRESCPECKIIVVTGWREALLKPEVQQMIDAVVDKPVEDTRLLETIRAVLST